MDKHFGSLVKKLRTKEGFTSYGLARAIDIDPSYMYRIECGKANPSKGIVKALADALRYSRTDFLETAGYKIGKLSADEYAEIKFLIDTGRLDFGRRRDESNLDKRHNLPWSSQLRISPMGIEKKAHRILNNYFNDFKPVIYPPIPIYAIAENLCGLSIRVENFLTTEFRGALNSFSGDISINSQDTVTSSRNHKAIRFTIAHELAHWFLAIYDDYFIEPPRYLIDAREYEANRLAAALLIPANLIVPLIENNLSHTIINTQKLAIMFDVSDETMNYRLQNLQNLGLIKPPLNSQRVQHWFSLPIWKREQLLSGVR